MAGALRPAWSTHALGKGPLSKEREIGWEAVGPLKIQCVAGGGGYQATKLSNGCVFTLELKRSSLKFWLVILLKSCLELSFSLCKMEFGGLLGGWDNNECDVMIKYLAQSRYLISSFGCYGLLTICRMHDNCTTGLSMRSLQFSFIHTCLVSSSC